MSPGLPGYTELCELGSGAGGRVVAARHEATGTVVAVKYLSDELRGDPEFVRAYRSEARVMADLRDQHIAQMYEYVEDAMQTAIVMELVDGVSLAALLADAGPLIPEAALVVMAGSLSALAAAHELGVVHRDYKPANVMVTRDGDSRLLDFGIAARSGASGITSGSPSYMAPEQWRGEPCGPAADIYAVTATFVECVCGHPPFSGPGLEELARQHQNAPPPVDAVPEPVRELVRSGLAKQPSQRPPTAAEFLERLTAAAVSGYGADWADRGRRHLAARVAALLALLPVGGAEVTASDLARTRFRRWAVAAGAAVLALVVGGGAAAVTPTLHHSTHRRLSAPTSFGPSGPVTSPPSDRSGPSSPAGPRTAPRTTGPTSAGDTSPGTVITTSRTSPAARHLPPLPPPTGHLSAPHTSAAAPTVVQKLEITGFAWGNKGAGPTATLSIYVATSGPGAVHLNLEFHGGGGFDRSAAPITLSGATTYYPSDTEDFTGVCGIISVTAKTDAGGFTSAALPTAQC